jgi:hypothetical protein
VSGWIAGPEAATDDIAEAGRLWQVRELARGYLRSSEAQSGLRTEVGEQLRALGKAGVERLLPRLGAIVERMEPPLHDERTGAAGATRLIRVFDDPNPHLPSEYAAWLPPEYHPARAYPAIVVLHSSETPEETLAPWIPEATRRGVILVAPEWRSGDGKGYLYSTDEHAAVLLAIRDALRRFSIDADRIVVSGMLEGGNMAWDFGLAHPDIFAGVAVISGLPAKYAWPYRANLDLVPMYVAMGDLAPTEGELVFDQWAKPQIQRNQDLLYTRYFRRGLERLPEEIPTVFQWLAGRTRDPAPRQFSAVTARECDNRFYGVVARSFGSGRTARPEGADPLGRNLKPAEIKGRANRVLNKLTVDTNGLLAFDVWVSPLTLDLTKRVEVEVGKRTVYKGQVDLDDPRAYLEDLRVRGDRRQPFWLKVPVNLEPRVGRRTPSR